jgi:hypothetical protein
LLRWLALWDLDHHVELGWETMIDRHGISVA